MDGEQPSPESSAGKSKTDLRRGQFTPGNSVAKKEPAPDKNSVTTNEEQSLLFDEGSERAE